MTGINHIFTRANVIHVSGIKAEQVVILYYLMFIIKKTRNVLTKAMHTIHSCDSYIACFLYDQPIKML